jgi:probable phosphoglycerate mutase
VAPESEAPRAGAQQAGTQQADTQQADTQQADIQQPGPGQAGDGVTVWYIRHGENPANLTGELSCRAVDYPLTGHGVEQALALAARLSRDSAPAAIYASPMRRADQTARIIALRVGVPVTTLEELRELDVGDLEGRRDEEAWELFLGVAGAWHAGDHDRACPGGEDFHQVLARLRAALGRALDHPPGSHVLVVAHDGLIRAALPALCPGTPPPATGLPKCGVAKLSVRRTPNGMACTLLSWPVA